MQGKRVVTTFGRVNPITTGHEKLFNHVKTLADKQHADHDIRLSHTQDSKKNPLTQEQKLKHVRRLFPNHNFSGSSAKSPSFLSHLKELHNKGYTHVTMVAGSDRVPEYQKLVDRYNKPANEGGEFHFKEIKVVSAGHRDPDAEGTEGISASKMREHAKNNDYHSFKKGLPSHATESHAREIFTDVRNGMKLHENVFLSFTQWLIS